MDVHFADPTFVYEDNKSVLYNTTLPESTSNKKLNSIADHRFREGISAKEWVDGYEPGDTNMSDILTEHVRSGKRRTRLVQSVMYSI